MSGRKTIIFGNGLGMALDSKFYLLSKALSDTWGASDDNDFFPATYLSPETKTLIETCLAKKGSPEGEDDLDKLQTSVFACNFLDNVGQGLQENNLHWLTEHGKNFPMVIRHYVHDVASAFHNSSYELPDDFASPLSEFIKKTKSHIATLNYDPLLYNLLKSDHLDGYNGDLVDGIWGAGFKESNLERKYQKNFGYYLHLHGSPLFYESSGKVKKASNPTTHKCGRHIVLTHVAHKPSIIASSVILKAYWKRLISCISESEEVILFGYSGLDDHLNQLISGRTNNVHIIEWKSPDYDEVERHQFWSDALQVDWPRLTPMESILEFIDW